jgi:hypothetical protein
MMYTWMILISVLLGTLYKIFTHKIENSNNTKTAAN